MVVRHNPNERMTSLGRSPSSTTRRTAITRSTCQYGWPILMRIDAINPPWFSVTPMGGFLPALRRRREAYGRVAELLVVPSTMACHAHSISQARKTVSATSNSSSRETLNARSPLTAAASSVKSPS